MFLHWSGIVPARRQGFIFYHRLSPAWWHVRHARYEGRNCNSFWQLYEQILTYVESNAIINVKCMRTLDKKKGKALSVRA